MGNDYTGVRPIYRWAKANSARKDGGRLEVHRLEIVPLDAELRAVLGILWEQYRFESSVAKADERQGWPYLAVAAWRSAKDTAAVASLVCFNLLGVEGPEHIHTADCLHGGDHGGGCPIFDAGYEHAQATARDWVSNDGPWYP